MWRLSSLAGYRITGVVGTAIVSLAGLAAGALPVPEGIWLGDWHTFAPNGLLAVYFGLTLLVIAWWWAGRDQVGPRSRIVTLAIWSTPLLAAPPLFSRDVYSYAAQGAMAWAGLDVYRFGVSHLGGTFAAQVAPAWLNTVTPYGPVSLAVSKSVMGLAGPSVMWAVLGMRLAALAGLGLLVFALPRLAVACGVDPSHALWLGALNPLVLLHLVAGAHNDALMLGLLAAGLTVAVGQRYALATVLVTLAALVKVPAAAGLIVIAALWRAPWRLVTTAVLTTVLATGLAGTGFGWITALGTPVDPHSWSLTSALGRLFGPASMRWWLAFGMGAALVLAAWAWHRRDRLATFGSPASLAPASLAPASLASADLASADLAPADLAPADLAPADLAPADLAPADLAPDRAPAVEVGADGGGERRHAGGEAKRDGGGERRMAAAVYALGLGLAAVAFLGPATRPWYALWGLVPIAAAAPPGRVRTVAAVAAGGLALLVLPSGFGPEGSQLALAVSGVLLALATVGVVRCAV